jgi:hypothetical protein
MTAFISPPPRLQFFTNAGVPMASGLLYTYAAGTTTPLVTYTDSSGLVANTNPVILDSRGEASIWLGGVGYKFKLATPANVDIWTQDNIAPDSSAYMTYTPAGTGAVTTTVQAKLRESVSVKDFGAVGDGVANDSAAFQLAIGSIAVSAHANVQVPAGIYLLNTSPTIASKTVSWILSSGVSFTGAGSLPGTIISVAGPAPAETGLRDWYVDTSNPDGAAPYVWWQHIPATDSAQPGVRGVGLSFRGDTSVQTPSVGTVEWNAIRVDYTIKAAAGKYMRSHLINGLLTVENDEAGSGNEGAIIIGTMRATGPLSGTAAVGIWGGDLHVEKYPGVLDGSMVGLEVGVHKAPVLGAAKCIGIDVWSGPRSGATPATRAGTGLRINGSSGWTNFADFIHTDGSTSIFKIDQNGNLSTLNPTGSASHVLTTQQVSTSNTFTLTSKDGAGVNCNLVLQSSSGGMIIGATTNQQVVFKQNNNEVFRLIDGFLLSTVVGLESTGAGSALLGANCPAVTVAAPYKWIKARTSDTSTVYFPVWK